MSCGIYKIKNNINGKIYIGQSIDIESRWQKHCSAKDDYNIHKALRKYGICNFTFSIIEECCQEKLNERERYWIKYYNSVNNGYNMTEGGDARLPVERYKSVNQYDLQGNYIQTFKNIAEASRTTKINHSLISRVCQGKGHHAGGFQWRYADNNITMKIDALNTPVFAERKIVQYSLTGEYIKTYNTIAEAKEINHWASSSQICQACQGKAKTAYGYLWSYEGNKPILPNNAGQKEKIVYQFDLNNKLIAKFKSQKEASEKTGVAKGNISNCCCGRRKTAGGFIWKFEKNIL